MIPFNAHPLESIDATPGAFPAMMSSPINGRWARVSGYYGVLVLIAKTAGMAGRDASLEFRQARESDSTGAKALSVDGYDVKAGASLGRARWVRRGAPGSAMDPGIAGDEECLAGVWIPSESLDDGFEWVQARYRFNPRAQDRTQRLAFFYLGFSPRHGGLNRARL